MRRGGLGRGLRGSLREPFQFGMEGDGREIACVWHVEPGPRVRWCALFAGVVDESRMVVTDQFVAEFSVHGRGRRVTARVVYGSTTS